MREVRITVPADGIIKDDPNDRFLAFVGENKAVRIIVDVSAWEETLGEGALYSIGIQSDKTLWPLLASAAPVEGIISELVPAEAIPKRTPVYIQIVAVIGDVRVKSAIVRKDVEASISGAAPEGADPAWIDRVTLAAAGVAGSADALSAQVEAAESGEGGRVSAENIRDAAEKDRSVAEGLRDEAETQRDTQEGQRQTDTAAAISGANAAATNASNAASAANTAAGSANTAAGTANTAATNATNAAAAANSVSGRTTALETTVGGHTSQLAESPNYRKVSGNPAKFYPVPLSSLAVKVLLTAVQSGSGDPSPTNIRPISPSLAAGGTVKPERTGKNLMPRPYYDGVSKTNNGIVFTVNSDGTVTANGIATADARFYFRYEKLGLLTGITGWFKISGCPAGGTLNTYSILNIFTAHRDIGTGVSLSTTPSSSMFKTIAIEVKSGTTVSNLVFKPQLEFSVAEATTVAVYEPYVANEYTLTAQQIKYGLTGAEAWISNDSEGDPTALIALDGTGTWTYVSSGTNTARFDGNVLANGLIGSVVSGICSHFPPGTNTSDNGDFEHFRTSVSMATALVIIVNKSRLTGWSDAWTNTQKQDAFKAWLAAQATAGTPVQVLYKRTTTTTASGAAVSIPAIAQLDRYTPRQNVVTVDKGSAEVGYSKSPIQTENELQAAIAALA